MNLVRGVYDNLRGLVLRHVHLLLHLRLHVYMRFVTGHLCVFGRGSSRTSTISTSCDKTATGEVGLRETYEVQPSLPIRATVPRSSVPRPEGSGCPAPRTPRALARADARRAPEHRHARHGVWTILRNYRRREVDSQEMPPLAYLLTFRCYGTWLPGDPRGFTDRRHGGYGTPRSAPCLLLRIATARRLEHAPIALGAAARAVVEAAIRDRCVHANWVLHAVNVRTNHVHVVVGATAPPERMMNQLKSWATRRLLLAAEISDGTRPWSRHGSTRYLWTTESIEAACRYVVEGQGVVLDRYPAGVRHADDA